MRDTGRGVTVRWWRCLVLAGSALVVVVGGGCRSTGPTTLAVEAGAYGQAFEATQDVVGGLGFRLERTDARLGVITTEPKLSAGWLTPWDREQQTARDEFSDAVNRQQRVVRVIFSPVAESQTPDPAVGDLRGHAGPIAIEVLVVVERLHRPRWQVQTESPRLSGFAEDRLLAARGMSPEYAVVQRRDDALAAEVVRRLEGKLEGGGGADRR